ncbi:MAG: PH domain-containing protein [Thermomicrobium sp.]|nr:PH domain-containing protein [Thermomicrobium sp.]MDW8058497.1 PH domain-containing protein [Thermomicrobium sp.]
MRAPPAIRYRARAAPSAGGLIGLALFLVLGATAVLAVMGLLGVTRSTLPSLALWSVFLLAGSGAVAIAYLLLAYFSIGYDITDDAIRVRWANRVEDIPVDRLTYAGPAAPLLGAVRRSWLPMWPGYYVGWLRTPFGRVRVVATQSVSRQLLLSTDAAHWAISPAQPVLFLEQLAAVRRRRERGETAARIAGREQLAAAGWTAAFPTVPGGVPAAPAQARVRPWRPAFLRDRVALGLLATTVLLLAGMIIYLLARSDALPATLVLHWNAAGLPDRIGTRRDLWLLPFVSFIVTVANVALALLAEQLEQFAARLLLGGTVIVLVLAWVALLTITL